MKAVTERQGDKETWRQGAGRAANLLVSLSPFLLVFLMLSSGGRLQAQDPPRVFCDLRDVDFDLRHASVVFLHST